MTKSIYISLYLYLSIDREREINKERERYRDIYRRPNLHSSKLPNKCITKKRPFIAAKDNN